VVNFIMHKKFATIFTFMRRTQERHVTCLQIKLCNFFYTKQGRRNVLPSVRKGQYFFIQTLC
jgi:hypothetical protein